MPYWLLYGLIVVADLVLIFIGNENLRWFTKPLLMPVLLIALLIHQKKEDSRPAYLVGVALGFSWLGDVFLQAKNLFIPGLLSFLLAHVCYTDYFLKAGRGKKGLVQKHSIILLPVLLYVLALLAIVFPHLGKLRIPVVVYSLTIGAMLLAAINSKGFLLQAASQRFLAGALIFVLSDSLLAINLFLLHHRSLSICVMATYAAAQWLIVNGALRAGTTETTTELISG